MNASNERIYHLLQVAAHRLRTLYDRQGLAAGGVTAAQAGALFVISGQPGITQRTLATTMRQQESAITAMVARLLEAGYVAREASPDDRRAWALRTTPKGEAALQAMRGPLAELNRMIEAAVGEDQIPALAAALRAIADLPAPDQAVREI